MTNAQRQDCETSIIQTGLDHSWAVMHTFCTSVGMHINIQTKFSDITLF